MNENPTQEVNSAEEEPGEVIRQGKRRRGSLAVFETTSTGERPAPVITTVPQKPELKPPYWHLPEAAKARLAEAQADAEKARREIEEIEDRYKSKSYDLAA